MVESPYAAPTERGVYENVEYLTRCLHDSLRRGEAPFASHGFYTMLLDDKIPEQRAKGLTCADAWLARCEQVAFYVDRGFSPGMVYRLETLVPEIGQRLVVHLRSLDHDAAWMRETIAGLPAHIREAIERVTLR